MRTRPKSNVGKARRAFTIAILAISLAGLLTLGRAADAAGLPSDVAQAWADYDRATISMDVDTLAGLVTDDYILVNSDASVQDKASYLADFKMPDFKLDRYEVEQPLERMLGNSALTGGVFNVGWTQDGRHQRRRLRFVHLWSKKDGRWRISYTQMTRIPQ